MNSIPTRTDAGSFFVALGRVPRSQQAGGGLEVDGLDQDTFLSVGQVRLALAGRGDEAGRRFLEPKRIIDAGKVDRVFHAAQDHRLLVVRPVPPLRQADTAGVTS